MSAIKNISKSFAQMKKRVFGQRKVAAMLGRADGQVVAGDGIVYATLKTGEVITVSNAKVPNRPYMKVWLGNDDYNPSTMQVLSERFVYGKPLTASLPLHGDKHKFPAEDTVWVDGNQFLPLLAIPGATAYSVKLYGSTVKWIDGAQYVNILPIDLDLSSLIPPDGAIYALLQVDDTGTLTAKAGTQVEAPELLSLADIPLPDTGQLELWAVRLYSGMDRVHKDEQVNDFVDLRWGRGAAGGGSGTGDVVGPASAVDGNIVSFDGTTGKLVKDSGVAAADVITDPETVAIALFADGPDVITNGTFDTDSTGWSVGAGWAWESDGAGGGWMRHTAGNTDPLSQSGTLYINVPFSISIDVGGTTGSVNIQLGSGSETTVPAGSIEYIIVKSWVASTDIISITPSSDFDGTIDNVFVNRMSPVKEAKFDGKMYGRRYGIWDPATEEAPIDGTAYVRKDGAWVSSPNAVETMQNLQTIDSPYTMNAFDAAHLWNAGGGDCVDNLIAATGSGKRIDIKKVDASAYTVTVTPSGADTIDGAADYVLSAQYESVTLLDAAPGAWYVL